MKNISLVLGAVLVFTSCSYEVINPDNPPNLRALSSDEVTVSSSLNDFGFRIFREVYNNENTFMSPLSVSITLGMLLNGASDETRQSILNMIDFKDLTAAQVNQAYKDLSELLLSMDRTVSFGIANSVWYHNQYDVNAQFADVIKVSYDGTVQALDFKNPTAVKTINRWVEIKTNNKIKNLIDQISEDEIMFLINAIYFKGDWQNQFDASQTHPADFTKEDGEVIRVNMMRSKGSKINYEINDEIQLVDIPYGNGQFRMTILVPMDGTLNDIIQSLTSSRLDSWIEESDSVSVELEIPKFKMTWEKDLKDVLADMGMPRGGYPDLFEQQLPLAISRVIHKSFLEVNEEGSEAAAATAIGIELTSLPSKPTRITIDKPFLFFIRENHSGVILFSGTLKDPSVLE